MVDDPYADRKRLTFAQAEGVEKLPTQLALGVISAQLRSLIWYVIYRYIESSTAKTYYGQFLEEPWVVILKDHFVIRQYRMIDEFEGIPAVDYVRRTINNGNYVEVFDLLQFIIRHRSVPKSFSIDLNAALEKGHAAYRIVDGNTIAPIVSKEEGVTLNRALADVANSEFEGARSHLKASIVCLTRGDYADSVRESMHAVESVARVLGGSGALSKALDALEGKAKIHPALKAGFAKIYGYTSDQKGIRHPLLDDAQANVDEADALFMLGACAAFVSYLIGKARDAGLLSIKK